MTGEKGFPPPPPPPHTHMPTAQENIQKASTNMHNKQALSPIDELPIPVNTKGLEAVTSSELE